MPRTTRIRIAAGALALATLAGGSALATPSALASPAPPVASPLGLADGVAAPLGVAGPAAVVPAHGPEIGGRGNQFFMRVGNATHTFHYGDFGDDVYVGDWNGDGADTLAVRRGAVFHVTNSNSPGVADYSFSFGIPGDEYLVGDWDGDGVDTLTIRRGSWLYVSNQRTPSIADWQYSYGDPGDHMFAGDWNGDGIDSIAIQRGDRYYVSNVNGTGVAEYELSYGSPGDVALAGDWDGNGADSLGVYRAGSATFYLRNSMTSGAADSSFVYGNRGDVPFAGRWSTSMGYDSVGLRRPPPGPQVSGVILAAWNAAGGAGGRLGAPTGNRQCLDNGVCFQAFAGGVIVEVAATGQTAVSYGNFTQYGVWAWPSGRPAPHAYASLWATPPSPVRSNPNAFHPDNGNIPGELCTIPWKPTMQLHCRTIVGFIGLDFAYQARFGTHVPIRNEVYAAYRTYAQQAYLYAIGNPTGTAAPGTSSHSWGHAIDWDTRYGYGSVQNQWLDQNGPTYGWERMSWNDSTGWWREYWHFDYAW